MQERVLFYPWGRGGAAAYTARCLLVADAMRSAGHQVAFAECGVTAMVRAADMPVLSQSTAGRGNEVQQHSLPYLPFGNVERVFAGAARYYNYRTLDAQFSEDMRVALEFDPSIIVIDMSPTASMVARSLGIPLVSIVDVDYLSPAKNSWMPWLTVAPEKVMPYPSCLPAFDRKSRELGLGALDEIADLLWGDLTLVASIPELERLPDDVPGKGELRYVGPLSWEPPDARLAFDPLPDDTGNVRIYVTIGSGTLMSDDALQTIIGLCEGQDWNVFISGGLRKFEQVKCPDNARMGGFTGIARPLEWADVVISHGGANTVLATLAHGKPTIVIPFMSETEMNGRNLVEKQHAGVLLRRTLVDQASYKIKFKNRYSGSTDDPSIRSEDVLSCVEEVIASDSMRVNAVRVGEALQESCADRDICQLVTSVRHR